jgi:pyruvate dehydrogenase E1 component alpha subunit/2-oxoisovalerate dehydrogenase E1 component
MLNKKVEDEIQKAVDFAEAGTWEPLEDLTKFVYSENKS